MKMPEKLLIEKIINFMTVIYKCYTNTTYVEDRVIYAKDLAMVMGWIVNIKSNNDTQNVVAEILSSQTDKYFGDYFKQGKWGTEELNALMELKKSLNNA